MSRRLDPWPAIADLFSGLLVATFGSLILFWGLQSIASKEGVRLAAERKKADEVRDRITAALEKTMAGELKKDCGPEEVCFTASIAFALDRDEILAGQQALRDTCRRLRLALKGVSPEHKEYVLVQIEGHTDDTVPTGIPAREAYVYNWNLSSRRASSVMYELDSCGLRNGEDLRLVAVGLADTEPLCVESIEACRSRNRRTVFRIRTDLNRIQKRLDQNGARAQ